MSQKTFWNREYLTPYLSSMPCYLSHKMVRLQNTTPSARYFFSILSTCIMLGLISKLDLYAKGLSFFFLYIPILAVAWLFSYREALVSLGVATLGVDLLFMAPALNLAIDNTSEIGNLYSFAAVSSFIAYFFGRKTKSQTNKNMSSNFENLTSSQYSKENDQSHPQHPFFSTKNDLYETVLNAAEVGVWEWHIPSNMIHYGGVQWKVFGFASPLQHPSLEEVFEKIHPEDREQVRESIIQSIHAKSDWSNEFRIFDSEDQVRWILGKATIKCAEDGEPEKMVGVNLDITQKKTAERNLAKTDKMLKTALEVLPVGVVLADSQGKLTTFNEAARQIWKGHPESQDIRGYGKFKGWWFGSNKAIAPEEWPMARAVLKGESSLSDRIQIQCFDGTRKIVSHHCVPVRGDNGESLGGIVAFEDITEEIEREKELRGNKDRLELAIAAARVGFYDWDIKADKVYFSDQMVQDWGVDPQEEGLTYKDILKYIHPEDRQNVELKVQKSLDYRQPYQNEFRVVHPNGNVVNVEVTGKITRDPTGEPLRFFGTSIDVTERRHNEQILRQSEERFKNLANSLPHLVWTAEADGMIDYWNERVNDYYESLLSLCDACGWHAILHPDDQQRTTEAWAKAMRTQQVYYCEHRVLMKDGKFRWHLSRAIPVKTDMNTIKWYGSATDIHEQKIALEKLAQAKEVADAANSAKSRFIANMSHEIRSPMNSVLGYADLLREKSLPEKERIAYASRIKVSGDHLLSIINDILDLSKVEAGETTIEQTRFPVIHVVSECVHSMAVLARKKDIDIHLSLKTPIPDHIQSDPFRLRQVLLNLLANSIKFTISGHIQVTLKFRHHKDKKPNNQFIIEVEDTGVGINPEKHSHLFQAFSQVDTSVTRQFGGTGLGLYLSRRLTQLLGGDLYMLWSVPGKGSAFGFSVDAGDCSKARFVTSVDEAKAPDPNSQQSLSPTNGTAKVLLVEDSPDNQALMRIYLKKIKADLDIANNGEEAVHLGRKKDYDLILMDIMMPKMDGLEATRQLRAAGFRKPIIALTAHALQEEVQKSFAAGCDVHLSKPVQRDKLINTIRGLLSQKARPLQRHCH